MMWNFALLFVVTQASLTLTSALDANPEELKTLKVTIGSPPTTAVLSGTLTLPCHIRYQPSAANVGRRAVLSAPRAKWSFISHGKEVEILVARGHKVKLSESYRFRASLPRYSASANDVTLVLKELRTNDSGIYRCHVQHGIEDDHDMLEVQVKGVVFLYREGATRYAYTFSMAQEACSRIKTQIATAEQLLASYQSGYEQCDAGWIADQTVRYPIQTPREGCYGDMDGYPGVRNYGVLDPDELYDVYCYAEELNGEVFLGSTHSKFTLVEARDYCRGLGTNMSTTGQLYAAWSEGLDHCSPGWLSDGSVRYPIITPRERCGGNSPGVKTIFQFRNQTGFPDSLDRYDVYCFRDKASQWNDTRPFLTEDSKDIPPAPVEGVSNIITVTESFEELKMSEVKAENEAQGSVDTIPLNKANGTKQSDGAEETNIFLTKDQEPPLHLPTPTLESAVSHKNLSESDVPENTEQDEEHSVYSLAGSEEAVRMENTTMSHQETSSADKIGSVPEHKLISSFHESNRGKVEESVDAPTKSTPGDAIFDVPFVNLDTENAYPTDNLTDSAQAVSESASHLHKPNVPEKSHPTPFSEKDLDPEEEKALNSYVQKNTVNIYNISISNHRQIETSPRETQVDPSHNLGILNADVDNTEGEKQLAHTDSYIDDKYFKLSPDTNSKMPETHTFVTHTTGTHQPTAEAKDFEASGYEDHGVFSGELTSRSPTPIVSLLQELVSGDVSGLTSAPVPLLSGPSDLPKDTQMLEHSLVVTTPMASASDSETHSSKSPVEEGSGELSGSIWIESTGEPLGDVNNTEEPKADSFPSILHREDTTSHLERTQVSSDSINSTIFSRRNQFDTSDKQPEEEEEETATAQVSRLLSPEVSPVYTSTVKDMAEEQPYTHGNNIVTTAVMSTFKSLDGPKEKEDTFLSSFHSVPRMDMLTPPPTDIPGNATSHTLEKTSHPNMSMNATHSPPAMPTERAILGAAVNMSDDCFPNPCENGGTCIEEEDGDFSCLCLPGYLGKVCEINVEKCFDDWDTFQGFCYKHFYTRRSWEDAEMHCRDSGGHLASITTPEEQDFVNNKYKEYQWTGLNDRTIEGDFQWSDGNPLLYENWHQGQPDSYFLSGENCVVMVWHDEGHWSDVPCNYHLPYTCKIGLVSCGSPPEVANASMYGKPKTHYQISSIVGYRCQDGFLQRNSPIIKCQADGLWEEPQLDCIPALQ